MSQKDLLSASKDDINSKLADPRPRKKKAPPIISFDSNEDEDMPIVMSSSSDATSKGRVKSSDGKEPKSSSLNNNEKQDLIRKTSYSMRNINSSNQQLSSFDSIKYDTATKKKKAAITDKQQQKQQNSAKYSKTSEDFKNKHRSLPADIDINIEGNNSSRKDTNEPKDFEEVRTKDLLLSEAFSVDYFYRAIIQQPMIGQLTAKINGKEMKSVFTSPQSQFTKSQRFLRGSFSPIQSEYLQEVMANSALSPRFSSTQQCLTKNIVLNHNSDSDSEESSECNSLDSSFKETKLAPSYVDRFTPTKQELQTIVRESIIFLKSGSSLIPSITNFDKIETPPDLTDKNQKKAFLNATIFHNKNKSKNNEANYVRANPPSVAYGEKAKKELALTENEIKSLRSTDFALIPTWNRIRDHLFAGSEENIKDASEYSLTYLFDPPTNDISTFDRGGKVYIDLICQTSFLALKFGHYITEPNIDLLHIFSFHNLRIDPLTIANTIKEISANLSNNSDSIVQMKSVLQYILIWVSHFPYDFISSSQCVPVINETLDNIIEKGKEAASDDSISIVGNVIYSIISVISAKERIPDSFYLGIKKPTFLCPQSKKSIRIINCKTDIPTFVKHLTYVELNIFKRLQYREFMDLNWTKIYNENDDDDNDDYEVLSPNIYKILDRFDQMAKFVASSIMIENSRRRARRIIYWIDVMSEARKQNNFQLLFEIDAALFSLPVNRLESSWKHVPTESIQSLNRVHRLTNPNHKSVLRYKDAIFADTKNTLPFIGPFLNELEYLRTNCPICKKIVSSGKEGYNMVLQRTYLEIVSHVFQDWGTVIEFDLDAQLAEDCRNLDELIDSNEELLITSLALEKAKSTESEYIQKFARKNIKK